MPAPHPPEFRLRAVELARQGDRPVRQIAKDLGISESCLRNWLAQADADAGRRDDRLTSDQRPPGPGLRRGRESRRPRPRKRHLKAVS